MKTRQFSAIVSKELKLFFSDRRALLMSFVSPIAIATFFGFLFSGNAGQDTAKIPILLVDHDGSAVSRAVVDGLRGETLISVAAAEDATARTAVRTGKATVAIVLPAGFGDAATRALFTGQGRPVVGFLEDPSHTMELGVVRGLLTQHVMEAVGREAFSGAGGRRMVRDSLADLEQAPNLAPRDRDALRSLLEGVGRWQDRNQETGERSGGASSAGSFSVPFEVKAEAITGRSGVAYNGYAHSFAGMGVQFVLFAAIELGIALLVERQRGAWQRLRSAPLAKSTLLAAKTTAGALIATISLGVTMAFGIVVFRIPVFGTWAGFVALILATGVMAAAFGLLLAALGKTPGGTRGIAILAVLLLVMLGGGWVPAFLFPRWMQTATLAVPTRWAVDGFDAVTWRGTGLAGVVLPITALLGFSGLFLAVAWWRFRWSEERD